MRIRWFNASARRERLGVKRWPFGRYLTEKAPGCHQARAMALL
jgi:hypothetical protein